MQSKFESQIESFKTETKTKRKKHLDSDVGSDKPKSPKK